MRTSLKKVVRKIRAWSGYTDKPDEDRTPYVINVTNTTTETVKNFEVLGALTYLYKPGWAGGSLTVNGVRISSGMGGEVSYQSLLGRSAILPFKAGRMYIMSLAGPKAQILQPFNVVVGNANGDEARRIVIPVISPMQMLDSLVEVQRGFCVDGYTKLVFSKILPSASFQFQLYPGEVIDSARDRALRQRRFWRIITAVFLVSLAANLYVAFNIATAGSMTAGYLMAASLAGLSLLTVFLQLYILKRVNDWQRV